MIDVEITGNLQEMRPRFRKLFRNIQGDLLNRLAQREAKLTRERVKDTKKTPDGEPWAERKGDEPHPLMVKSGDYLRSIRAVREDRSTINMGPDTDYDIFQHEGTKNMVARPAVGVGEEDIRNLDRLIDTWVSKQSI